MEVRVLWWYETFFHVWCSGNDILQVWITRFLLQSTGASSTSMIWKGKSSRRQICQSHVHWKKHTPAWHGWTSFYMRSSLYHNCHNRRHCDFLLSDLDIKSQSMQCHLPLKTTLEHAINLVFGKRESCQNDTFQVGECLLWYNSFGHPKSLTTEPDS